MNNHFFITYERGQVIGNCEFILELSPKIDTRGKSDRHAKFKCVCGGEFEARISQVKTGRTKSCGCRPFKLPEILPGKEINGILFLCEEAREDPRRRRGRFLCACGKEFITSVSSVSRGKRRTCGCAYKLNSLTHGLSRTSEHNIWLSMKARCLNPNSHAYPEYGGRGITISDEWKNSFETFLSDMGPKPSPAHSIERVNNALGYAKENCRWATRKEQNRNTKKNIFVNFRGRRMLLIELCEELGRPNALVHKRYVTQKWDLEKALFTPVIMRGLKVHTC